MEEAGEKEIKMCLMEGQMGKEVRYKDKKEINSLKRKCQKSQKKGPCHQQTDVDKQ
jgi:hypothetical protein